VAIKSRSASTPDSLTPFRRLPSTDSINCSNNPPRGLATGLNVALTLCTLLFTEPYDDWLLHLIQGKGTTQPMYLLYCTKRDR